VHRFVEFDQVRVIALHGPAVDRLAAPASARPPQIGDTGTIVHLVPTFDPDNPATRYVVERSGPDGRLVWLAEFARDELEFVSPDS
jgi:hypothetical protein